MSRVDELLAKYNPNGVDSFQLSGICYNHDSKRKPISKSNRIPGSIPYYGANGIQDYVAEYIFDGEYILVGEDGTVTTENGYPIVKWVNGKFWVNNHAHIFSENKNIALLKFIYYFLQTIYIKDLVRGLPPKLTKEALLSIKLKNPHIKVQEEIVKILDSFTNLIDALNEELLLRQKQFEYYREKLLTFTDNKNVLKISNFSTIQSGRNKERKEDGEFPLFGSTGLISRTDIPVYEGDYILIARVGANAGFTYRVNGKFDVSDNTLIVTITKKNIINLNYLYHCLIKQNLNKYAKGGGQPLVTSSELKNISIPVPSLSIQQSIVSKLDAFESLISSLKEEIALRQKQYEYYREKLLTFE